MFILCRWETEAYQQMKKGSCMKSPWTTCWLMRLATGKDWSSLLRASIHQLPCSCSEALTAYMPQFHFLYCFWCKPASGSHCKVFWWLRKGYLMWNFRLFILRSKHISGYKTWNRHIHWESWVNGSCVLADGGI